MEHDVTISEIDIEHHLQRQILLQLRQHGKQRHAELKPEGVEGNAFNYHLRLLKKARLILLTDDHYELTPTGSLVADSFSYDRKRLLLRPHAYTFLLVTAGDKVLVYHSLRHPTAGRLGLLGGKMHFGDTYPSSIERELARRRLNVGSSYTVLCPINIRYRKKSEIVMHRPGLVWHIAYGGDLVETTTASGRAYWLDIEELLKDNTALPDITVALERLHANSHEPIDLDSEL